MSEIIRTQINRNGTVTIWNTMKDSKNHDICYTIDRPKRITQDKLARLNELRDFNRLTEREKFLAKFPHVVNHVPGEKGNCLSQAR